MGMPKPSLLLSDEDKELLLSIPSPNDCVAVQRDDIQHLWESHERAHVEAWNMFVESNYIAALRLALEDDEKRWKSEYQQAAKAKVVGLIKRKTHEINQLKLSAREKKRRIEQMTKKQKARHPDLFKRKTEY